MKTQKLMSERKVLVVVLGMHRSGTSAITRGLLALSVELGDRLMPAAVGNNEKGFWEDLDINALNTDLMRALGHEWDSLEPVEVDTLLGPKCDVFRARAQILLREKMCEAPIFGLKDPRLCRVLPFWKLVFSDLNLDVRYLISMRNPLSVADSLKARDGFILEKSAYLWLVYTLNALEHTVGEKRVAVDFDLLMNFPRREMLRIASALRLRVGDGEKKALVQYAGEFLDGRLRHAQHSALALKAERRVPAPVRALFTLCEKVVRDEDRIDSEAVSAALASVALAVEELAPAFRCLGASELYTRSLEQLSSRQSRALKDVLVTDLTCYFAAADQGFSEASTVRAPLIVGGGVQTIQASIPKGVTQLRLDPAAMPCIVRVDALRWFSPSGDLVLNWTQPEDFSFVGETDVQVRRAHDNDQRLELVCFGTDPHVILAIPAALQSALCLDALVLELQLEAFVVADEASLQTRDIVARIDDHASGIKRAVALSTGELSALIRAGVESESDLLIKGLQGLADTVATLRATMAIELDGNRQFVASRLDVVDQIVRVRGDSIQDQLNSGLGVLQHQVDACLRVLSEQGLSIETRLTAVDQALKQQEETILGATAAHAIELCERIDSVVSTLQTNAQQLAGQSREAMLDALSSLNTCVAAVQSHLTDLLAQQDGRLADALDMSFGKVHQQLDVVSDATRDGQAATQAALVTAITHADTHIAALLAGVVTELQAEARQLAGQQDGRWMDALDMTFDKIHQQLGVVSAATRDGQVTTEATLLAAITHTDAHVAALFGQQMSEINRTIQGQSVIIQDLHDNLRQVQAECSAGLATNDVIQLKLARAELDLAAARQSLQTLKNLRGTHFLCWVHQLPLDLFDK